ncbi:hypothetical protein ERJ75_000062900 [Trypanosoma vivax]|nr:hypothetical protein ERJ75_000062900 [Trypanosoma vivax]
MSSVRIAAFTKYFAAGATVATLCCARHCNWTLAQHHAEIQRQFHSVEGFAEHATALEKMMGLCPAAEKVE